jgi:hypothetical protein
MTPLTGQLDYTLTKVSGLTVFLVETTMALVEDSAVFAYRHSDMGNPG